MSKFKLIAVLVFFSVTANAHDSSFFKMSEVSADTVPVDILSVGVGGGYEFGGIGVNVSLFDLRALTNTMTHSNATICKFYVRLLRSLIIIEVLL